MAEARGLAEVQRGRNKKKKKKKKGRKKKKKEINGEIGEFCDNVKARQVADG